LASDLPFLASLVFDQWARELLHVKLVQVILICRYLMEDINQLESAQDSMSQQFVHTSQMMNRQEQVAQFFNSFRLRHTEVFSELQSLVEVAIASGEDVLYIEGQ